MPVLTMSHNTLHVAVPRRSSDRFFLVQTHQHCCSEREGQRHRGGWHVKFRRAIYIERVRVTVEECDHRTTTLDKAALTSIQSTH
jgi:hypothetical protein